jgi:predicted AlkP superfamily phosphohydrolase/phosphomutase
MELSMTKKRLLLVGWDSADWKLIHPLMATGKMAYHHGVPGFTEVEPQSGAIVPVSAATRKCKTVWEILAERGLKSHIVSWFATQGERDIPGKMVSNMYCHVPDVPADSDPANWPPLHQVPTFLMSSQNS